ncbi:NAD-dependent malic enzyme [Limosilactobacillus mucosae]|uniref:malolactic enzyme n=1 Tax=Limosilactobacillus mucosae TaxID=97478 RepID=UPI0023B0C138|nr:malolactic enzyme [Limosilactobacillus mucosae]MDE8676956.1 NAD-dependent malic enzyme [Limosilactobacillus mucosae]MDX2311767.1 NAD-dependent malic enzyme [Limosilactobacillus mucosae]
MRGFQILNDPFLNRGTAFTEAERRQYGLIGLLPPRVKTIDEQAAEMYALYQSKGSLIEKRHFLMEIFNHNRTLFFNLMVRHIDEFMPIVYDPVIAEAIERYNERFMQPQDAAYLTVDDPDTIEQRLQNAADRRDVRLIVVTDAEGILGIGDWGVNGVDIAVGKLMVYTAAAGIDPQQVLPVVIDAGTDNQQLLADDEYLGTRHERLSGEAYFAYIDRFVAAVEKLFPKSLLHFEDFGRGTAAQILDKYQDRILTFNDDIQGTGVIALAGVLGALNISGQSIAEQRFLTFGAGTAGMGIVKMLYNELIKQGMSPKEAKQHFYLVDRQGLLFEDTPGLTPKQQAFVRSRDEFADAGELTDLPAIIKAVQPTVMIGTSTVHNAFTEAAIKEMAKHADRPIVFPISNPTEKIEATPADLIKWTNGKALVATGIPSATVAYQGIDYQIGQANNALIYPGVGFGALAVNARIINDEMLAAAAHALGGLVDVKAPGAPVLPPVSQLTAFSKQVAIAVAQSAIDQGLAQTDLSAEQAVAAMHWQPEYQPFDQLLANYRK